MEASELIEFILGIDSLTTSEFCEKYNVPKPKFTGDVESSIDNLLQIDAVKHRLFVEKAKQLYQRRITLEYLKDVISHSNIKNYEFEYLDGEYNPPINRYKFKNFHLDIRIFAGSIGFHTQVGKIYGIETSIPICESRNSNMAECVRFIFRKIVEQYY